MTVGLRTAQVLDFARTVINITLRACREELVPRPAKKRRASLDSSGQVGHCPAPMVRGGTLKSKKVVPRSAKECGGLGTLNFSTKSQIWEKLVEVEYDNMHNFARRYSRCGS